MEGGEILDSLARVKNYHSCNRRVCDRATPMARPQAPAPRDHGSRSPVTSELRAHCGRLGERTVHENMVIYGREVSFSFREIPSVLGVLWPSGVGAVPHTVPVAVPASLAAFCFFLQESYFSF